MTLVTLTQRAEPRAKRVKIKSQGECTLWVSKPQELAELDVNCFGLITPFVFSIFTPFELECLNCYLCACPTIVS